ncbi:hypothetical protein COY32_00080, partial [candidate division WWE3 bacterium CG_4_10_14_0_2_um_filter_41_14]
MKVVDFLRSYLRKFWQSAVSSSANVWRQRMIVSTGVTPCIWLFFCGGDRARSPGIRRGILHMPVPLGIVKLFDLFVSMFRRGGPPWPPVVGFVGALRAMPVMFRRGEARLARYLSPVFNRFGRVTTRPYKIVGASIASIAVIALFAVMS